MKQIVPGFWDIDEIGNQVHAFMLEWEQGITLIDTGMPNHAQIILDVLKKRGIALHQVRRIIITHCDVDHAGSAAQLRRATGAQIVAHSVEKEYLEHPNLRKPAVFWLRPIFALLMQLPAFHQRPVVVDELVVDGQETPEGFTIIHTPGHTPGHISLLHKKQRLLIAGDALVNRGNKLTGNHSPFTPDKKNADRSIWKLAKKYGDDFDKIVFGHGDAILQNGGQKVKSLASQIFSSET